MIGRKTKNSSLGALDKSLLNLKKKLIWRNLRTLAIISIGNSRSISTNLGSDVERLTIGE